MTWLAITEYLCHKRPWICSISSFITYHWILTSVTGRVPLVEQENPFTVSEIPGFREGHVGKSLVLRVLYITVLLSIFVCLCIVGPSIFGL